MSSERVSIRTLRLPWTAEKLSAERATTTGRYHEPGWGHDHIHLTIKPFSLPCLLLVRSTGRFCCFCFCAALRLFFGLADGRRRWMLVGAAPPNYDDEVWLLLRHRDRQLHRHPPARNPKQSRAASSKSRTQAETRVVSPVVYYASGAPAVLPLRQLTAETRKIAVACWHRP